MISHCEQRLIPDGDSILGVWPAQRIDLYGNISFIICLMHCCSDHKIEAYVFLTKRHLYVVHGDGKEEVLDNLY